jgi:hypothetical protein
VYLQASNLEMRQASVYRAIKTNAFHKNVSHHLKKLIPLFLRFVLEYSPWIVETRNMKSNQARQCETENNMSDDRMNFVETDETLLHDETTKAQPAKRRGRPKGSKNRKSVYMLPDEGWDIDSSVDMATPTATAPVGKAKSAALHRRWQREWIRPQFALSRKDAYEIFFKFLRSAKGKDALKKLITNGSPGVGKLTDAQLGKYLEQTNLLSRYPHEVVIKG